MVRVILALALVALAFPAAADDFEHVGVSLFAFYQQPSGAAARGLGGGLAAGWDEPGYARWSPAAPSDARRLTDFGVAYEHQPTILETLSWNRWTWSLRADLGDVSVSLVRDGWTSDPVVVRTAYQPEGYETELTARQEIGAVSWRAKTWAGRDAVTVLNVGAGLRRLHLGEPTAQGLDDLDLGLALTHTAVAADAPGLKSWTVGVAATHLGGATFDEGDLETPVAGHRRLGARAVWNAAPRGPGDRSLLTVTALADWERARLDGWHGDGSMGAGVETLWAGMVSFRYGWRDRPTGSQFAAGSFGFGLRRSLLDDRLHLRADMAVVDMNENLGYDTLEVYSVRVGWTP